jgi:hypothetical protein
MKYTLLSIISFCFFNIIAQAASPFAGKYNLITVYYSGENAGQGGYGTATVSSRGVVAYTIYYASTGNTGKGQGGISNNGTFSFKNGPSGSGKIVGKTVVFGNFIDPDGDKGYFAMKKK